MSELDYIGASELVFNNDIEGGIHSGGFSVNSIMLKNGMSPIMTFNTEQTGGKLDKVSIIVSFSIEFSNVILTDSQ